MLKAAAVLIVSGALLLGLLAACGAGSSSLPREHWDSQLKAAIRSQVTG